MREVKKYNTDKFKIINFDNIYTHDFSRVKNIQFKNFQNIGNIQKNIYTDYENYCVLDVDILYINEERYKNDSSLNNLINYVFSKTLEKEIKICNKDLINDRLIYTICNNPNITRVSISDYVLTTEHYNMFKKANIEVDTEYISQELEENFDPIIIYNRNKKLIGKETYSRLLHGVFITITDDITDYELENFKYISEYCEIIISNDNIDDYKKILKRLKELNLNIPISFNINNVNKDEFYEFILNNNISDDNIYVQVKHYSNAVTNDKVKLCDFLKYEKILFEMIKDAVNLSPFERYIYAYNITKQFKIYKESEYNKQDSRWLYRLLNNEYMVCVGFSNLFGDLLNKLGINNVGLSTDVDNSYKGIKKDAIDIHDIKSVEFGGHNRRFVHLVDEKYGINGFYVADPTWDNDLEYDYYNHMIMTNNEVTYAKSYVKLSFDDIFNVKSIEEYIFKMKSIFNRSDNDLFKNQIKFILEIIRDLDNNFYNILCNKYPYVKNLSSFKIFPNVTSLIYELGIYIVSKVNKTVNGETIFNGVREIYKHSYGYNDDILDETLDNVREYNKDRHKKFFPIRYRVNKDGSMEIIMNENNKFDFDLNVKKI